MADLVSIIIPTFYRNELVVEAIESALDQTHEPVEVIVVDDSGTEHARPVVEPYLSQIQYVAHDQNRGEAEARRTAVNHAEGRYLQFLDDDDLLHPEKIELQLPLLDQDAVEVVYCGASWPRYDLSPKHRGDVLREALMFSMTPCCTPTMLFCRSLLADVGDLARYPLLQDVWLIIEFARRTEFDYVDDLLVTVRDDEGYSLFNSPETPRVFEQIVDDYAALYDQFPERIRDQAISHTFAIKGYALLSRDLWSPQATAAFWQSYRHHPDHDVKLLRRVVVSLFGRFGLRIAQRIAQR